MGPGPAGPDLKNKSEEELKKDETSLMTSLGFLPFSVAVSFFFMWAISGSGQPSNMVRLMAFNNSITLKKSIFTVAMYYSMIYFPLVLIFCSARILLPGLELDPDSIMPRIAVELTANAGQAWLAGLLVAAPFAAIMSTVDSFLLMISSAVVRDIYQRNINPDASDTRIKYMSYLTTLIIGVIAMAGAINPPRFLQDIIVYTGSGLSACFLGPIVFALYWPRMNREGMYGGMLAGFAAHFSMYAAGMKINGSFFKAWQPMGIDPIVIGLFVSFVTTFVVASLTPPPDESLVDRYFRRGKANPEK
jgi:SSS family solute:Na+ symporter/sodium/pantothenate symporter